MDSRSVGFFENRKYIDSHRGFFTASPEGKGKLLGKKFLATIRNQFVNCWHRFDTFRNCWVFPRVFLEVSSSLFVARLNTQMDSWSIIYPRDPERHAKKEFRVKKSWEKKHWMDGGNKLVKKQVCSCWPIVRGVGDNFWHQKPCLLRTGYAWNSTGSELVLTAKT